MVAKQRGIPHPQACPLLSCAVHSCRRLGGMFMPEMDEKKTIPELPAWSFLRLSRVQKHFGEMGDVLEQEAFVSLSSVRRKAFAVHSRDETLIGSMCPNSICLGLDVVPIWILYGQSILIWIHGPLREVLTAPSDLQNRSPPRSE